MKEEQKTTLVHAINHFGVEGQINKAVEEMGELITELSRRNLSRFDKDRVAEEVADALIMLEQLRIIFGASKVDGCVSGKLERLEKTINGDWRRQERMMPKGMVKHREEKESEARKGSLVGECIEAGLTAGLKSIDPDLAEKVAKWAKEAVPTVVPEESIDRKCFLCGRHMETAMLTGLREKFERYLKKTQERHDAKDIRRCCLFCKHIRASVRDPFCGITGQEIIGGPRATCCGRFEPTTEKEGGTNE